MYEERKKRINWVKLFLIIVIVFLLLLLTLKCISMIKNRGTNMEDYYGDQLSELNKVALDYYNKDNIPEEVGKSAKKSLKELKKEKVSFELEARKGETCDLEESYIQATRLDTEYQVKTYIVCGEYKDYINSYVSLNGNKEDDVATTKKTSKKTTEKATTEKKEYPSSKPATTSTTTTTTTTTTKKVATTKVVTTTTRVLNTTQATAKAATDNEVNIRFNANGGTVITDSIIIKKGTSTKLPVPVRYGYDFRGWYYNGVKYTSDTKFDNSIILVAMWSEN